MAGGVHPVQHPLVADKLLRLRDRRTPPAEWRRLVYQISLLLVYEATRNLPTAARQVETPIAVADGAAVPEEEILLVPVLRAGLGMVDAALTLLPGAAVGHVGLERDHATHRPRTYYCRLPRDLARYTCLLLDPMLATGGSAKAALDFLVERGACAMSLVGLIAAPEGVRCVQSSHPDVDIWVAAIDERLNADAYIVPGLGDAGDRLYGSGSFS